jgi:hypothetical protein
MIVLLPEKRISHNYYNEKLVKWILENQSEYQFDSAGTTQGFGCGCEIESRYKYGKLDGFYRINDDGTETWYMDYVWHIDADYIIPLLPDLTEDEIEEIEDIEQIWVYYCPECHSWALDGANI